MAKIPQYVDQSRLDANTNQSAYTRGAIGRRGNAEASVGAAVARLGNTVTGVAEAAQSHMDQVHAQDVADWTVEDNHFQRTNADDIINDPDGAPDGSDMLEKFDASQAGGQNDPAAVSEAPGTEITVEGTVRPGTVGAAKAANQPPDAAHGSWTGGRTKAERQAARSSRQTYLRERERVKKAQAVKQSNFHAERTNDGALIWANVIWLLIPSRETLLHGSGECLCGNRL